MLPQPGVRHRVGDVSNLHCKVDEPIRQVLRRQILFSHWLIFFIGSFYIVSLCSPKWENGK